MEKRKGFLTILVPALTVFISSACIMVIELVASRLIARHLGSSLYTWTSVIGVVLAGITIGNYLGGRLADKFNPRKTLSLLFCLASAACVFIIILNNVVGEWIWLWKLSWPVRVFSHVSIVFLLPSVLLGMISPVVATMALKSGLPTGRTVGDIYAFGAAGSIAGTFLAGFCLIATLGTVTIVWIVGSVLLVLGALYYWRMWFVYVWALIFVAVMTMGMMPAGKAAQLGSDLGLREKDDPAILYQDETQYCWVAVKQVSKEPDHRYFMQDKLKHSEVIMGDLDDLRDFYIQMFAAITRHHAAEKKTIRALTIGGGGYIFPQYIEKYWPGSRNDVAEIDPGVTRAAIAGFGLQEDSAIHTIALDARNYIDSLLADRDSGKETPLYDFVYEDAFNDYNVPFQLVTKEINDKIFDILTDDGVYIINMIDVLDRGVFLPAYLNTLRQTFPYLHIVTQNLPQSFRSTFIITASKIPVDVESAIQKYDPDADHRYFDNTKAQEIAAKAGGLVLTDDYAPTENLLTPVVRQSAIEFLTARYRSQAFAFKKDAKLPEAIDCFQRMIDTDFNVAVEAYNEIGILSAQSGQMDKAIDAFKKALDANQKIEPMGNPANMHFSLAVALQSANRQQEASEQFDLAIKNFELELAKQPESIRYLGLIGDSYASKGDFGKAAEFFTKIVDLEPTNLNHHIKRIQALEYGGQVPAAITAARQAYNFFNKYDQREGAAVLQQYITRLENR